MAVEIMSETELAQLVANPEMTEQWKELVREMNLKGQEKMLTAEVGDETSTPIPYPHMNSGMVNVYKTLCPQRDAFERYNTTTIPLRVLEEAKLAMNKSFFKALFVWHDEEAPDPILVGSLSGNEYTTDNLYIIARWGDELRSFTELRDIAKKRFMANRKATLSKHQANLDADAEKFMSGQWVETSIS